MNDAPKRGEVWLVNFNPGRGSEQQGIRPAVVIQNNVGNQFAGTTIVAAITKTIRVYPVTVFLRKRTAGLSYDSMINCAQVLTVDKKRLYRRLGMLDQAVVRQLDKALKVSVGLWM